ncbi:uncharacterized histidine-rich protein DDB_G0274557 [Galendromus occidentalis]|uniref:Uncharacterized histidine-rich protein DDB_G0274557 n=1 Tax=Galendromus occidentalis TaxID=34638 RepID=A0AAJ7L3K3_9ACAR|nr:uncharacterized histidine-rich protein DDB_G0274557 [Galendromus occidentalis]
MIHKLLASCVVLVAVFAVGVLSSDEWDHDAKWVPPTTYRIGHYEKPLLKLSHNGLKWSSSLAHLFNKGHKHHGHTKHVVKVHHHHVEDAGWHPHHHGGWHSHHHGGWHSHDPWW